MPVREKGEGVPVRRLHVPSHVPGHTQTAAKVRGFSPTAPGCTAEIDSPLEEDGFEPSVPLVSRGAIRREFPKRGARLAASWGVELRRRSSIWEFDPTSRDQTRGILLRHLDDAIQADGDMPV
jgi:hypothetical protein